jgi:cystathionine gamma-synthase
MDANDCAAATWLVAGGRGIEPGAPLNVPLVPASTFTLDGARAYARDDGTPTWDALEQLVGGLDHGEAVAFSSGMAAIAAVFDQLHVGAHIVWPTDCYQGVAGLIQHGEQRGRWVTTRLALEATSDWCAAAAEADLTWIESPSNPLLTVADLHRIGASARRPGSLLVVDNTLAGPLLQQPLDHGADIVIHSATKHLGGHSDLLCGIATTRRLELAHELRRRRELAGATPGTLEAFLVARGIRTLALRTERSNRTALELARRLEAHPAVTRVRHPGLASHPTHDIAAGQLGGYGSVISFDIAGDADAADAVCADLVLIRHATSFGAVESTIERRAAVPGQEHLPVSLLRLSVGIEDPEDIWNDLAQALDRLPDHPDTRTP